MTKKEAKNLIKKEGLYEAIYTLMIDGRDDNLIDAVYNTLDNIDDAIIKKAVKALR